MEYILKKLSKLNEEISGVPVVCSYFRENNIETPPTSARNKKSTSKGGGEDKEGHAEYLSLKDIDNKHNSLIVTILPCETCLKEILENHKNIKNIYFLGEYKNKLKHNKYEELGLDITPIQITRFIPQTEIEKELSAKIYVHFLVYAIEKYFKREVPKIIEKEKWEVETGEEYALYTYLKIIQFLEPDALEVIDESKTNSDESKIKFSINLVILKNWWKKIEKLIEEEKFFSFLIKSKIGEKSFLLPSQKKCSNIIECQSG